MNEEANNNRDGNDSLHRLIREGQGGKTFLRPSDEAVDAYVYGGATQSQKREVRSAMLASEEFRREVLGKCQEADALKSPEVRKTFDTAIVGPYPDFSALQSDTSYVANTIASKFPIKWMSSIAAAAAIVVTVAYFTINRPESLQSNNNESKTAPNALLVPDSGQSTIRPAPLRQFLSLRVHTARVEKSMLMKLSALRSADGLESSGDSSAFDSAIRSFAKVLALDSNGYLQPAVRTVGSGISAPSDELYRKIFISSGLNETSGVQFNLPISAAGARIWVLSLPSQSLSFSDQIGDSLGVDLSALSPSTYVLVTLTFPDGSAYSATPAQQILPKQQ